MRYLLLLLLITNPAIAEVYKTINPDGSVTYSDVPTKDAETITPPELTPTPAIKLPKKPAKAKKDEKDIPKKYTTFRVSSPENNAVIRDNNGAVAISFSIEPALQTKYKHSITLFLNGKPHKKNISSTSVKLTDINRGQHTLSAQIVNAKGTVLKQANKVVIHLKRHSRLHGKTAPLWPTIDDFPKPPGTPPTL